MIAVQEEKRRFLLASASKARRLIGSDKRGIQSLNRTKAASATTASAISASIWSAARSKGWVVQLASMHRPAVSG
jgi:hypothetical protein